MVSRSGQSSVNELLKEKLGFSEIEIWAKFWKFPSTLKTKQNKAAHTWEMPEPMFVVLMIILEIFCCRMNARNYLSKITDDLIQLSCFVKHLIIQGVPRNMTVGK